MSTRTKATLLRRTTVAAAAVACMFAVADAGAASIKLNNGNNNECVYSGMTIDPAGNVTVTCTTSGPVQPGQPGTFSLSTSGGSAPANSVQNPSVMRAGGATGAATVSYTTSGCASPSGSVNFADNDAAAKPLSITVGASGTCTVTLGTTTAGTIGSPNAATFTVAANTPPPAPSNCPTGFTPPADMLTATLGGAGSILRQMQSSGQVVSIPLPAVPWSTGQIGISESPTTYSPQPVTIEISINKCPGLIEPYSSGNYCNLSSTNGNYNSITWFAKPYSVVNSAESLISRGLPYCWAGDAGVQYYANMRWTYNGCPYGQRLCGFQIQYNQGPY